MKDKHKLFIVGKYGWGENNLKLTQKFRSKRILKYLKILMTKN